MMSGGNITIARVPTLVQIMDSFTHIETWSPQRES